MSDQSVNVAKSPRVVVFDLEQVDRLSCCPDITSAHRCFSVQQLYVAEILLEYTQDLTPPAEMTISL
jgi:hypothetical protein